MAADVPEAVQPHGRACSSRPRSRTARRSRRRPTSRRWSRTTRATPRSPRARRSIPRPPTSSRARSARSCPAALKVALLPKKTRGGTVVGAVDAALRRREEPDGQGRRRPTSPADMLMRGTHEAHAPADPGRARPPQGARERGRPRDAGERCRSRRSRENLPAVLRARRPRCCASPRSPRRSSRSCEQENLAAIEQQRSEPDARRLERLPAAT